MKLYINLNNTFIVLFLMINIFFKFFSSNNHSNMYMSSIYINTPPYLLIYTTPYTPYTRTPYLGFTCICHIHYTLYTRIPTWVSPVYVHIHYILHTRTAYIVFTCICTFTLHIIHQNTLPRSHQYPINPCTFTLKITYKSTPEPCWQL